MTISSCEMELIEYEIKTYFDLSKKEINAFLDKTDVFIDLKSKL
jgi:hypothetical protein